jgi:tRNA pseudouridine13 synthase
MMQSTYPLERDLGMRYYASDTDGVGGKLRSTPEDFIVEEIPLDDKGGTTGPYLICSLTKKNWELQHAVKEIANRLGISHRRIGWGGTKDRNAVTRQRISIYNVTPEQVAAIRLKDITIEPVGFANASLSLGDLQGNRFDLMIRDVELDQLEENMREITSTVADGVPNYFGLQRFGAIRPVTHAVGEWILRGDYEQAVVTYVGMAFPGEADYVQKIRSSFVATRDPVPALQNLPSQMSYERAMLHHLHNHPGDYGGSLLELPPKLLSMFVSAYQSYLFNCALSLRFDRGYLLTDPVPGDQLIFANGRVDTVTAENTKAVFLHIARGRCGIALFMPGREPLEGITGGDGTMAMLLAEHGITAGDFDKASKFVRTKFDGAWRPIALKTIVEYSIDQMGVRLKFTLPPGHYATTVCREYMKADPIRMI